jgi:predicted membrane channel-forming protein YqfA (hemolysin III family)
LGIALIASNNPFGVTCPKNKKDMIQRMQSLYLLGIVLIIGALCFGSTFEQWSIAETGQQLYSLNLSSLKIYDTNHTLINSEIQWLTLVPAVLLAGYVLNILFAFKDRKKQLKLSRWSFLLFALLYVLAVSNGYRSVPGFSLTLSIKGSLFGSLLFIFLYYLNFRALMLIKHDEELVRSADRIR